MLGRVFTPVALCCQDNAGEQQSAKDAATKIVQEKLTKVTAELGGWKQKAEAAELTVKRMKEASAEGGEGGGAAIAEVSPTLLGLLRHNLAPRLLRTRGHSWAPTVSSEQSCMRAQMAEENAKLKGQVEKLTANGKIALEKLQEKMKESTEGTLASLFLLRS